MLWIRENLFFITMKKNSYITVTDQFCGAGGSSQGVRNFSNTIGGGVEVKLALNHWKLAIETHNTNFPDTIHDCTDISASDPRRYPATDILITSPECTNHSLAKGKKQVKAQLDLFDKNLLDPAAERSRATMWDVPRFAEYHDYNIIIVENVVDARKWLMWDAWLMAMHSLGYDHKCCYFNSMHFHPTPQSRDRMYVVFWKKKNNAPDLNYQPKAHCAECGCDVDAVQAWKKNKFGKFKTQYVYRCPVHHTIVEPYYYAAFNAIDWSNLGTRIGDRSKPLSSNTIKRIQYGLDKYCPDPFVVNDQHTSGIDFRVKPVSDHLPTMATRNNYKLIMPMIMKGEHTMSEGYIKPADQPFLTQTVRQSMAIITPQIIELNRTGKSRSSTEALSTVLTSGSHHGILTPFVPVARGQSKAHRVTDPLSTQSSMINHGIVTTEAFNSFISYYYGKAQSTNITDPFGTTTTKDRYQLISYQKPNIEDCFYRMIKPPEIKKAMAFDHDYIILGSGKDQVKQCGNAVTPPVMQWLVQQCVKSLAA